MGAGTLVLVRSEVLNLLRGLTGAAVGALVGAAVGALACGAPVYMVGDLPGVLGRTADWVLLAAVVGALGGAVPGALAGLLVGLIRSGKALGALIGAAHVMVVTCYIFSVTSPFERPVRLWALLLIPGGALVGLLAAVIVRFIWGRT